MHRTQPIMQYVDPQRRFRTPHAGHRGGAGGEQLTGRPKEAPAALGEPGGAGRALEQRRLESLLEALDALGQRLLRDAEPLSGPAEMQLLGGHHERPYQGQVEVHEVILC